MVTLVARVLAIGVTLFLILGVGGMGDLGLVVIAVMVVIGDLGLVVVVVIGDLIGDLAPTLPPGSEIQSPRREAASRVPAQTELTPRAVVTRGGTPLEVHRVLAAPARSQRGVRSG